ncbi:carboxypeptidase regulatory-like domain-containing protein [Intrasporangium sp. YIM S08009]|uniref:carboxypeptidase regulatory-like domain-containing protein n=1 Tax=Intrasporangium zincisolvens TaxID=3080018 RepID=UPI002B05D73E|nr:carboxypeptidase regulatory-like domain-containing protein [Intrasporangium sp. YIM S08009]
MLRHRFAVRRAQGNTSRRAMRRALIVATTLATSLGLVPALGAPAQAATYTITGRVTGLSSTGTVVGVGDAALWFYDAARNDAGSVTYNADGTYTATFSAPGPYRIEAGCWGEMTCASQWGIEWYADQGSFDSATPVTAGTTATVADIRLDRRSTIKGTVKDTAGQPVSGFDVMATKAAGGMSVSDTSAADGSFTLTGVESGPSNVTASDPADQHVYASASWDGTKSTSDYVDWTIPAGTTVTGVDFVLDPWTGVIVKVTDASGKPLQNINWNLFEYRPTEGDWFGRQYGPLLTGTDGTFAEQTEVGKTYRICAYDTWYDNGWAPTTRYQDRCYDNAATLETATSFTVTSDTRKRELTMVLPVAGKGLTAREPFVSGSSAAGSTLTVDAGTWEPSGVALGYQWMRQGTDGLVPIAGATGPSFTTTSDLVGTYVVAKVTGTLAGYRSAEMYSNGVDVKTTGAALSSPLTVTGSGVVGSTLTATHGAISPAGDWSPSYTWVVGGVPRDTDWGAVQPLTLTSDMMGKRITLRMAAYGPTGAGSLQQSATGPAVAGALTAPTPTVSGTKAVGYTLTAVPGTWGPAPVTLAYQWYRSGAAVSGATAATYALTTADQGKTMTVRVTGTKSGYATAAKTSAATTAVLGALTAPTPTVSGTKAVGYTLTAVPGTWGPAPVTLAYQWYRSGAAVSGATAATYALTTADQGKTMTVRVTGTKSGYATAAKTSAATTAVLGALTAPTPTVSGTKAVGYTLTAVPGTWGPAPVTLAYQWYRSGAAISGATAATYKLTTADQGKAMTVRVTGSKTGYLAVARTSAATSAVLGAFTAPTPTISGTRKVAYTLTAVPGTWSPTPTTFSYQWYRSGVAISGATARTYKLTSLDKGKYVKVRVTGVRSGYLSRAVYSAQTAAIA